MNLTGISIIGQLRCTNVDPGSGDEEWDKVVELMVPGKAALPISFVETFFFDLPTGAIIGQNVSEDIAINDVLIGEGDGSQTSFSGTLTAPVKPSSVTILYTIGSTPYTATDNGTGSISGTNLTGTITYNTGAVSLTFSSAPTGSITADFVRGLATDDTLAAGITFGLATDTNPDIKDTNDFSYLVPLTGMSVVSFDKIHQEKLDIYRIVCSASYTGTTPSNPITAVAVYYNYLKKVSGGVTAEKKPIMKSIAVKGNPVYGGTGLVLSNRTDITLTLEIQCQI